MTPLKNVHFPPTQQRILNVLADGKSHDRKELCEAIDELATVANLNKNLGLIRGVLRPLGYDIICALVNRKICYQHIIKYPPQPHPEIPSV